MHCAVFFISPMNLLLTSEFHDTDLCRCDSMGFCAQFGAYTLMETKLNRIIDVESVSVSATSKSYFVQCMGPQH